MWLTMFSFIKAFFSKTGTAGGPLNWVKIIGIGLLLVVVVGLGGLLLWEKYQHGKTQLQLEKQIAHTTALLIDNETLKTNITTLETISKQHELSVDEMSHQLKLCFESAKQVQQDMDELNRIMSGDTSGYDDDPMEVTPTGSEHTSLKEDIKNVPKVTEKQVKAGFDFINRQFGNVK